MESQQNFPFLIVCCAIQKTNIEGQYFWDEYGNKFSSDVSNATGGGFPAVVGFNAQEILDGKNWTEHVRLAYAKGSVITFYWSAHNPVSGGSSRDCSESPLESLLPGGDGYTRWTHDLRVIGEFFKSLKFEGKHIPVIFRLFHECTGDWYWWGTKCADSDTYIQAWRFTQRYLRDQVGVHNLLWIYAASKISWTEDLTFNDWYPGNEYVDIIGFDRYSKESEYKFNMLADCRVAVNHSKTLGKIVGLAETGISDGIQDVTSSKWFMKEFLEVITQDDLCHHLSYALTFANESPDKYWVPLENQVR